MTYDTDNPDENTAKQVKSTLKATGQRRMRTDGKVEQEWVKIQHDEIGKEISRSRFWQIV